MSMAFAAFARCSFCQYPIRGAVQKQLLVTAAPGALSAACGGAISEVMCASCSCWRPFHHRPVPLLPGNGSGSSTGDGSQPGGTLAAAAAALGRELEGQRAEGARWRARFQPERELRTLSEGAMEDMLGARLVLSRCWVRMCQPVCLPICQPVAWLAG